MTALKTAQEENTSLAVLLIEDSMEDGVSIIKACMEETSHYDFHIIRKYTLEGGIDYIKQHPVDIVLLDLGLPDARELKAVKTIHATFPKLPIVIISGYSNVDMVKEALENGAQEFLIKGESSGAVIRQSMYQALARKRIELARQKGGKL